MNELPLTCQDDQRRHEVRRQNANGLDYLEVSDDQLRLTVYFLGPAPEGLTRHNVRITGGQRVRDIVVTDVEVCEPHDPELDNCMIVTVDTFGDYSTYTLCLVDLPDHLVFDPRYLCLEFSFKAGCPSEFDCKTAPVCPPEPRDEPEISYLAKDYASFRQLIFDRMALLMPGWTERHVPDLGVTLVEVLAYTGDYLSYYQDAVATEAYLQTARQRISVRRHARLVDYLMHEGCNARAWVHIDTDDDEELPADKMSFITGFNDALPVQGKNLTWDDLRTVPARRYEVFEPLLEKPGPLSVYRAHNTIHFYTWGNQDCCLPRGATSATLIDGPARTVQPPPPPNTDDYSEDDADVLKESGQAYYVPDVLPYERVLHLDVGDVLIFEEAIGPETGNPADADPSHRHAVRLTKVVETVDELYGQPLLEIAWMEEDALPFPLCLSTLGPPPNCRWLENVSVARGNVLLVDHGRRVDPEALGCVPVDKATITCENAGRPSDPVYTPGLFNPALGKAPLTFSEPLAVGAPASSMITQDPRLALPWVLLCSYPDCEPTDYDSVDPLLPDPADEDQNPSDDQDPETVRAAAQDPDDDAPADEQDPGATPNPAPSPKTWWTAQRDLLASNDDDYHFVVEMDNEGRGHLRFGDGELGRQPNANAAFETTYRVGNGPAGNVGAHAISHVVFDTNFTLSGVTLTPRNPLPARGGTAPEPIDEVKLFAPHTFRRELQRAITAEDYAALVMREFADKVQRATAELCWSGSWYTVHVAIDSRGQIEADKALLQEIEDCLYRYRRIGHDVDVCLAEYIALNIELKICVEDSFLRGHVAAALRECFSNRLLPDGNLGFFHPDNLSFGEAIYLSKIVAKAQAVPGVESVSVTRFQRLFEEPNCEIENGVLPLGSMEIARLDNDPNFPENGIITFDMRGGR